MAIADGVVHPRIILREDVKSDLVIGVNRGNEKVDLRTLKSLTGITSTDIILDECYAAVSYNAKPPVLSVEFDEVKEFGFSATMDRSEAIQKMRVGLERVRSELLSIAGQQEMDIVVC